MCDFEVIGAPSRLSLIRKAATLARMLPILDLICEANARGGMDLAKIDSSFICFFKKIKLFFPHLTAGEEQGKSDALYASTVIG